MAAVVFVEGLSDEIALETLAVRRRRDLGAEGVEIVVLGGAQAIGRALRGIGDGVAVAGLCDAGEEREFRRALDGAGRGPARTREDLEARGFYVCDADLEDELIRAVGPVQVEELLAEHRDLVPFRTLQKQPAWAGMPLDAQLRRFLGSGGSRKLRYARHLVEALDLARVPRPLDGVLDAARLPHAGDEDA